MAPPVAPVPAAGPQHAAVAPPVAPVPAAGVASVRAGANDAPKFVAVVWHADKCIDKRQFSLKPGMCQC